jgi:hypothetical protein
MEIKKVSNRKFSYLNSALLQGWSEVAGGGRKDYVENYDETFRKPECGGCPEWSAELGMCWATRKNMPLRCRASG